MLTAEQTANDARAFNKIAGPAYRRLDTLCENAPCWIILETPTGANVVYEDEPDAICVNGNHPGRYADAE